MAAIFTYGINTGSPNPPIDWLRLLVADTVEFGEDGTTPIYIFSDQELTAMTQVVQAQFQSSMFYSTPSGATGGGTMGSYLPALPIPFYRIAGMLLMSIAANKARLSSVLKLLDVTLDPARAAKALKDQADSYFEQDDNSGALMIIEQVNNSWSFADRMFKQWQRQGQGGF